MANRYAEVIKKYGHRGGLLSRLTAPVSRGSQWGAEHPTEYGLMLATLGTSPYWGPLLTGGGGAGAAGGGGGASASATAPLTATGAGTAGTTTAAGVLPSTTTVPLSTGTVAGLAPSGAVPASVAGSSAAPSVLGRVGSILSSPAGLAGIGTAGSLIGAGIQSSGISKAAEIEAQFQREALAYEKQRDQYLQNLEAQRYGELNQRLQPYMDLGTTRGDKLAALLGVNPASYQYGTEAGAEQPPAQTWPGVNQATYGAIQPTQANFRPRPPGVPSEGTAVPRPGTMGGQTVMVRAPTGETRQLSPEQAQQAVARGAQIVSG